MWCVRATKKVKDSTPYIQEAKTRDDVIRQRKQFARTHNQYTDEECAEPQEIGDILKNYMGDGKDVNNA